MPLTGEYEPSSPGWAQEQTEQVIAAGTTDVLASDRGQVVLVTYRGRRTGRLRKMPVIRVEQDGAYAIVASKGGAPEHPLWYTNIVADPHVELMDGATSHDYTARDLTGPEKQAWWDRAVAVFPPYAEYQTKTDRQIPVLLLEPTG